MTIKQTKRSLNWKKIFEIARKEEDYKKILNKYKRYAVTNFDIVRFYFGFNKDSEEKSKNFYSKLKSICGQREDQAENALGEKMCDLPDNLSRFFKEVPNEKNKVINENVVLDLIDKLVAAYQHEFFLKKANTKGKNKAKCPPKHFELTAKDHSIMLKKFIALSNSMIVLTNHADICGIDSKAACYIIERLSTGKLAAEYYAHVTKNFKKLKGPSNNDFSNKHLLYLVLYLVFYGGYKQNEAVRAIMDLLELVDNRFSDHPVFTEEVLMMRLNRTGKAYLRKRQKKNHA
ncbi:MAG: hypothetical protein HQM16_15450 [Deltaproteobacteria bacterium]|nr:hypothetical protein [Deltaproteobacteria bacterium]